MIAHTAVIAPGGELRLPANVRHVEVFDHGRRLIQMSDPADDTCVRQSSFVRSHRDLTIVAERVRCWGDVIDNYTRHDRLRVRWER